MKLNKSYHIYGLFQCMMSLRSILTILLIAGFEAARAEGEVGPDFMRSVGNIYVVAGVCLIILITLLLYMVRVDQRISKLEKRQKNE